MSDSLRCPFCQAAVPVTAQHAGSRTIRAGDVLVCEQCLAPSLIRRAKGRKGPRLSAPPASMLITLRRHPQVRAIIDAIQHGTERPAAPVTLQAIMAPPDEEAPVEIEIPYPRPVITDRPPERWDVRVGVWMDLQAGMAADVVAAKYGTGHEFVAEVERDGLFPSYYRVVQRGDRIMVDDGSGAFVSWTTPTPDTLRRAHAPLTLQRSEARSA